MSITETPMPPYPWQAEIWQTFCESVSGKRVPHALLIDGVEGVGVGPLAYSMARYLLCVSPLEDVACGRCRGCQLISSETHPDLFILKREEKAAVIKVDQVRACVDFVAKTSFADGPKVVVVEQADTMNINAANALLKSLEEPQGQTVFLLTTNRISAILPTIRSRCRGVSVLTPKQSVASSWLADQGINFDEAVLAQAGGAPVLVKQWVEGDYLEVQAQVAEAIAQLLSRQDGAIQVASKWQSLDLESTLQIHIQVLESAIKARHVQPSSNALTSSLMALLDGIEEHYLFRLRDKLLTKIGLVRSSANLNAAMLNEELAMDWVALAQLVRR